MTDPISIAAMIWSRALAEAAKQGGRCVRALQEIACKGTVKRERPRPSVRERARRAGRDFAQHLQEQEDRQ